MKQILGMLLFADSLLAGTARNFWYILQQGLVEAVPSVPSSALKNYFESFGISKKTILGKIVP